MTAQRLNLFLNIIYPFDMEFISDNMMYTYITMPKRLSISRNIFLKYPKGKRLWLYATLDDCTISEVNTYK